MKIFVTLSDVINLGLGAILLIVCAVCILIAVIDCATKDWRYHHFKCPKCSHMHENGVCGHFRNHMCDCNYYCKRRNK